MKKPPRLRGLMGKSQDPVWALSDLRMISL